MFGLRGLCVLLSASSNTVAGNLLGRSSASRRSISCSTSNLKAELARTQKAAETTRAGGSGSMTHSSTTVTGLSAAHSPPTPPGTSGETKTLKALGEVSAVKHPDFAQLTVGQMRVFCEIVTGASEAEIARKLNLSSAAVHKYAKSIYSCLKVHSRDELIQKFLDVQQHS